MITMDWTTHHLSCYHQPSKHPQTSPKQFLGETDWQETNHTATVVSSWILFWLQFDVHSIF